MANPVAVTNGLQTFAFGDLPKVVNLDGTGSYDEDDGIITAYQWTLQSKPAGSSAAIADDAAAETTITIDLPGDYLVTLVVSVGGTDSPSNLFEDPAMPDSAQAVIQVTLEHRDLIAPADNERAYGDAFRLAVAVLDELAGDFDTHVANATVHWGKASTANYGVSKLTAAPASATVPIAVGANDARWLTLVAGGASNADGLHTHAYAAGDGRHHDLRPDLLIGANDKTWSGAQIAALTRSQNIAGARDAYAVADGDGLLQLDIEKEDTKVTAGVLWASPAGDFEAIIDLRLSFDGGDFTAQDIEQHMVAGFGWQLTAALGTPARLCAVGLCLSEWGFRAADFGASDSANSGATANWNAASLILTPVVRTGLMVTEFLCRLRRTSTAMVGEVSFGGGGYVPMARWTGVSALAGKFCLFGAFKRATTGLRIKSTGVRLRTPDTWFGA